MAWKEQVEGWELENLGENDNGDMIGTGERIFVESPGTFGCLTSLPKIGDKMTNPAGPTTYNNIFCTSIKYKRTHSSGADGLTATISYASPELSTSADQREKDKEAGTFSADLVTLNVQGGTTWFWYLDNAKEGWTTDFPFDIPDVDNGGPCAENLPIAVTQIQRTKRIKFADDAKLDAWMPKVALYGGKVNNDKFLGFNEGQVLVGGITGSKNNGIWEVDIVFIVRLIGGGVTRDDWNMMPSDAEGGVKFHRPVKTIVDISGSDVIASAKAQSYMYEYANIESLLDPDPIPEP